MAIFARPASTRPGPTLMGQVLPGLIRNRVGYEFFFKNPKGVQVGSRFYKKNPRLDPKPGPNKNPVPWNYKNTIYIYTYNLTLIPHFSSAATELSSLPASIRHSLSLISTQSNTSTLLHPHSHTPSHLPPLVRHSLSLSSVTPTHPQFDKGTNLFKTLTHHLR